MTWHNSVVPTSPTTQPIRLRPTEAPPVSALRASLQSALVWAVVEWRATRFLGHLAAERQPRCFWHRSSACDVMGSHRSRAQRGRPGLLGCCMPARCAGFARFSRLGSFCLAPFPAELVTSRSALPYRLGGPASRPRRAARCSIAGQRARHGLSAWLLRRKCYQSTPIPPACFVQGTREHSRGHAGAEFRPCSFLTRPPSAPALPSDAGVQLFTACFLAAMGRSQSQSSLSAWLLRRKCCQTAPALPAL